MVAWGAPGCGGDTSAVASQLTETRLISTVSLPSRGLDVNNNLDSQQQQCWHLHAVSVLLWCS